jgi:hypothetical protein
MTFFKSLLSDQQINLHQYILTLTSSSPQNQSINTKLYTDIYSRPLYWVFCTQRRIILWQMMVPSVNKPSKSMLRPFIDSDIHGFIWTEINLICKCYCSHRAHIRFPPWRCDRKRKYKQHSLSNAYLPLTLISSCIWFVPLETKLSMSIEW